MFINSQYRIKIDTKYWGFCIGAAFGDDSVSVNGEFEDKKQSPNALGILFFIFLLHFFITIYRTLAPIRIIDLYNRR